MMRRDDPNSHIFIPPCGSQEGQDSCWLCGKPKSEHPTEDIETDKEWARHQPHTAQ